MITSKYIYMWVVEFGEINFRQNIGIQSKSGFFDTGFFVFNPCINCFSIRTIPL